MAEEYNPDIVSVVDEDGVEHIFEELDRIETEDGKFVALLPVYDDAEDIIDDDGEIIILKVEEEDNGDTFLCPIEDEKLFNEVGKYFEDEYMAVPLFWNINYVSLVRQPLYNYVQRSGSITNTSMNIKKVKDIMTFKKKRIKFFKEKKCDILYGYAIQDYKNWIIEFVSTNKISSSKLKGTLQKEYRKNISVRYVNNPKILFKDIVGGINISLMGWLHKKVGNSQGM